MVRSIPAVPKPLELAQPNRNFFGPERPNRADQSSVILYPRWFATYASKKQKSRAEPKAQPNATQPNEHPNPTQPNRIANVVPVAAPGRIVLSSASPTHTALFREKQPILSARKSHIAKQRVSYNSGCRETKPT